MYFGFRISSRQAANTVFAGSGRRQIANGRVPSSFAQKNQPIPQRAGPARALMTGHLNAGADIWLIHVMVVEDEPVIRSLLVDELRDVGFSVVEAASADEALLCSEQEAKIDLLFTDVQMPGTMNGLDLVRSLRHASPSLPAIITSGNVGAQSIGGLGHFLPKPYRLNEAVSLVYDVLGIDRPNM